MNFNSIINKGFSAGFVAALFAVLTVLSVGGAQADQTEYIYDKVPPGVFDTVASGAPVDVIVLLDDAAILEEAARMRLERGVPHDTPEILEFKASRYTNLKLGVTDGLPYSSYEVLKEYSHLPITFLKIRTIEGLNRLLERQDVLRIYPDEKHTHFLSQSLALINQPPVASSGKIGTGTTVAVLDTGVDYTRAAFGYCTAPNSPPGCKVVYAQDFAPNDGHLDDDGHGTNVAGIVLGVAPDTRIAALDVFRTDGYAYSSDIISAINWCISNKSTYNIVAINMSLGGGGYTSACGGSVFSSPISNAKNAGIISSIASGNDGYTNKISDPGCVPSAVSVGAVYDSNVGSKYWSVCTDLTTYADKVTCFSNSASFLTILAPGSVITAAGISMSGTSQAAPHVAGAIAVLKGLGGFSSDSADQTISRMTGTGVPVYDSRNGITKPRLDLQAAAGGGSGSYSVSGTITTSTGIAIAGVAVALNSVPSATTDSSGNFTITGVSNGTYTLTPGKTGYTFTPSSRSVTVNNANVTGQNFTGTAADATYSISGNITVNSGRLRLPLAGVVVSLSSGATATTDSSGNFIITGVSNGTYTLTPGKTGYTFTPSSRSVTVNNANVTGQNFTGTYTGSACTYSISPASQNFTSSGGSGSVGVTAGAGCAWTAVSNAAWITVTAGSSGTGSGTVNYSVAANTGGARTGTITIAGQTFTVTQEAAGGGGCTYGISPTSKTFTYTGGSGSVGVTAGAGCAWTAVSNAAWITVTAGASGTGSGTVNYSVAANLGTTRTGTITIAGQTFTITQTGRIR